jgi:hypothetical protein
MFVSIPNHQVEDGGTPIFSVTIFFNQDLVNTIERALKGALRNDNVPGHHIWGEKWQL